MTLMNCLVVICGGPILFKTEEAGPYKAEIWIWLGGNGDTDEIVRNFDTGQILSKRRPMCV